MNQILIPYKGIAKKAALAGMLLGLYTPKQANSVMDAIRNIGTEESTRNQMSAIGIPIGAGVGAAGGGLIGAGLGGATGALFASEDEEGKTHRLRNALLGAAVGGAGGVGIGGIGGGIAGAKIGDMVGDAAHITPSEIWRDSDRNFLEKMIMAPTPGSSIADALGPNRKKSTGGAAVIENLAQGLKDLFLKKSDFYERASELDTQREEAILKSANGLEGIMEFINGLDPKYRNALMGGLAGGAGGLATGMFGGNGIRNALLGALGGAGLGYAGTGKNWLGQGKEMWDKLTGPAETESTTMQALNNSPGNRGVVGENPAALGAALGLGGSPAGASQPGWSDTPLSTAMAPKQTPIQKGIDLGVQTVKNKVSDAGTMIAKPFNAAADTIKNFIRPVGDTYNYLTTPQ